jgi:germination protein M
MLLVNELLKSGHSVSVSTPAAPATDTIAPKLQGQNEQNLVSHEVTLYFGSADGRTLTPEKRSMEYSDSTVENCRRALKALIAGPREAPAPILPGSTQIRALYLLDTGELVVDFSREIISDQIRLKSASLESLLVYGVVNTLAQEALQTKKQAPVRKVRFLFEGAPPQESFPAHIDLTDPIVPDPRWTLASATSPSHA